MPEVPGFCGSGIDRNRPSGHRAVTRVPLGTRSAGAILALSARSGRAQGGTSDRSTRGRRADSDDWHHEVVNAPDLPSWVGDEFDQSVAEVMDVAGPRSFDAVERVLTHEMDHPSVPERKVMASGLMSRLPDDAYDSRDASPAEVSAAQASIDRLTRTIRSRWDDSPPELNDESTVLASVVYILVTSLRPLGPSHFRHLGGDEAGDRVGVVALDGRHHV